ncbi:MAG: hypothetical protein ACYTGZ_08720 [Planctomycetota bacterium]|jgi:hypothetical protein
MRVLIATLLLAAVASAQSIEDLVSEAVKSTTGPKERDALMTKLVEQPGGAAALAAAALDPLRDPEVVHAAVEILLGSGKSGPHVAAISRLLLSETHRAKVSQRIQEHVEKPEQGRKLVAQLAPLAKGGTGNDRLAAIRALGRIPLRGAVEVIVLVWNQSDDAALKAACQEELDGVVEAADAPDATRFLAARAFASYYDLVREVSRHRKARVDRLSAELNRRLKMAFLRATPEEVFAAFASGSREEKPFAAARAKELAAAKEYGKAGAAEFTKQIVDCLLKELDGGSRKTAIELFGTIQKLLADQAVGKSGLPRDAEVRDALRVGAAGGADEAEFATLALGLLRGLGAGAVPVINEYANRHKSPDVRKTAVQALGDLASKGDTALKATVGGLLADLLATNPSRPVLRQILFTLRTAPSDDAIGSIQKLLFPTDPKLVLERGDIILCVELLAASPSPRALETLERVARESTDAKLRLDAVQRGLLKHTLSGADSGRVLSFLAGLVRDSNQPETVRSGVIAALGGQGNRLAAPLLGAFAVDDKLEAPYRAAAVKQRIILAGRLVQANESVTDEDLATVATILSSNGAIAGADPKAMIAIARAAAQAADRRKIKAGACRAIYAELIGKQKDTKPEDLRAAWKEAADKSAADGLTQARQIKVWLAYRKLLFAADPKKAGERPLVEQWVHASLRLRDLAEQTGDTPGSLGYWLDALDVAVAKLKDRNVADTVVDRRPPGELAGDLLVRWEKLAEQLKTLKG